MTDQWDQFPDAPKAQSDPWSAFPDAKPSAASQASQGEPTTWADIAKAVPSGLARGVSGALGAPGEIGHGMRYLTDKARQAMGYAASPEYVAGTGRFANPLDVEPKDVQRRIEQATGPLYEPKTTAGRYVGAASEIAGGSAIPFGGASSRAAQAGVDLLPYARNWLTSSIGAGTAGETAKELDAPPLVQAGASIAGGLTPSALNTAFSKAPASQRMIDATRAAEAAQAEGISVPKGAVAGPLLKPVAGRVASIPLIGDPLTNAARQSLDEVGARAQQIAGAYGQGNRATSGANLRDAIVDYIETGSREPIKRLYDRVDNLVDDTLVHNLPSTTSLAYKLMQAQTAAARDTNEKALATIIRESQANPNGLTYSGIKELRTKIGSMLDDALLPEAGTMKPVLKQIYGSLTDDLKASVRAAGQPGAIDAFEKANAMNEIVSRRREQLAKIVGKSGANAGENVFETMIQMAQDTGKSANINSLMRARKSVDPQTWNDFSSAFIRRMGINPQTGDFSPDRALTAYGKLSPEGKQILFSSTGRGDLAQSLDRLKDINEQFSQFYKLGNPSGTGGVNFITGFFHSPLSSVAATIGGRFAAKYFASPANVDKMSQALQARLNYVRTPNPGTEQRAAMAVSSLMQSLKPYQTESTPMQQAAGGAVNHAQRLKEIESGPHSPEQKRAMRRKIIEHALNNP